MNVNLLEPERTSAAIAASNPFFFLANENVQKLAFKAKWKCLICQFSGIGVMQLLQKH